MKSIILDQWDEEADVVVVGFGGAGAVAAITAKDAGADVLILEKQLPDKHTPNTLMCAGACQVANDIQKAAIYFKSVAFGLGLPDSCGDPPHIYPTYPKQFVEEVTQAWAEGVVHTREFLESLGEVNLKDTIFGASFHQFNGMQNCGIFEVKGRGIELFNHLAKAVHNRGIRVLWENPGKSLITGGQGEIVGVIAQRGDKTINIKARKAIVLANGGFECDEELKEAFLPGWGWSFIGNPDNTGDGLRMAMEVGAALGHMHHNAARIVAGGAIVKDIGTAFNCPISEAGKLLVDNYGLRYANEELAAKDPDRYHFYKRLTVFDTSKFEFPRIPSWFIFDERARLKGPVIITFYGAHAVGIHKWSQDNSVEIKKGWILKGDSIEDLAHRIAVHRDNKGRMSATNLSNTIARFNEYSGKGEDLEFGRSRETLGELNRPPYYAIAEYPGGPNTEGGPIKNAKCQIINVFGKPVPRLYAAGEVASVWSFLYQVGGNIAECIIHGRIAGKNAAAEKPWD